MIQDILRRLVTAIFFTGIVIGGLMWNEWSYIALFILINFFCAYEYLSIVMKEDSGTTRFLGALTATLPSMAGMMMFNKDVSTFKPMIMPSLALMVFIFIASTLKIDNENPFRKIGHILTALVYTGIPCYFAHKMGLHNDAFTFLPLLGIILLIWSNDTAAYLIGSLIGKTPFAPSISPKKTLEGTLGGIFFTILMAWPISMINEVFSLNQWIIMAVAVGILGTIGDLVESKFKRYYQIKDSGNIMPGHGGFLDRFDSFLFIMPIAYLLSQAFIIIFK